VLIIAESLDSHVTNLGGALGISGTAALSTDSRLLVLTLLAVVASITVVVGVA